MSVNFASKETALEMFCFILPKASSIELSSPFIAQYDEPVSSLSFSAFSKTSSSAFKSSSSVSLWISALSISLI